MLRIMMVDIFWQNLKHFVNDLTVNVSKISKFVNNETVNISNTLVFIIIIYQSLFLLLQLLLLFVYVKTLL